MKYVCDRWTLDGLCFLSGWSTAFWWSLQWPALPCRQRTHSSQQHTLMMLESIYGQTEPSIPEWFPLLFPQLKSRRSWVFQPPVAQDMVWDTLHHHWTAFLFWFFNHFFIKCSCFHVVDVLISRIAFWIAYYYYYATMVLWTLLRLS